MDAAGKDISLTDGAGTAEFIFNLEDAPEIDVDGDFTIDGSGLIKLDSATERIEAVGNITASGDISASGNVIGNMYHPTFHNFNLNTNSEVYIPFPTSETDDSSVSYLREWIAPFDGSLSKIRFRGSTAARNTTFKLYVNAVIAGGATATSDTVNAGLADTTYTFTFDETAAVYSAGDLLRVTIDPLIAPGDVNLTMIWNYDTSTL